MTWTYAYTPEIWPPLAVALLLASLSLYSWRQRSAPGALPLAVSAASAMLWMLCAACAAAAVAPATKIAWYRFEAACKLPAVTTAICFVLEYAYPGHWLTRRNLALIALPPLIALLVIAVAGGRFAWQSLEVGPDGVVLARQTALLRILESYGVGLVLVEVAAFAWLFIRSPQYRWPVALMLFGSIASRGLFLLDRGGALAWRALDAETFAVSLTWATYAIALFGFRILDPLAAARQAVIGQLFAGVVVLGADGRVLSLNPAAERMLGVAESAARGHPWQDVLPPLSLACLASADHLPVGAATELPDLTLGSGAAARQVAPALSPLTDFRGLQVGYLLMLRDITEQKRAQARILEQQRALAIQNERERMARELHDSLGQLLGYTSLQVQTAAQLSRNGQGEAAGTQLDQMDRIVREAHADLREYILNLRSTASFQQPFFPAVKQYLDGFTSNYDIQTLLNVSPEWPAESLAPEIRLQLFRILQEALSNARRHGRAHQVQVTFTRQYGRLCMSIQDNGCGFELEPATKGGSAHYGLQFMHERAAQLGGHLEIVSAPGAGTRIDLCLPWKEG